MKVWDYKVELTDVPGPTTPLGKYVKAHRRSLGAFSPSHCTLQQSQNSPLVKVKAENYLFLCHSKVAGEALRVD
ncbi:MAG: hypothetical protein IPG26_03525 [Coprothermobacter sp.]|nr:hypothetical protein [Coprothermobacter sp.]